MQLQDRALLISALNNIEEFTQKLRMSILDPSNKNRIQSINDAILLGKLQSAASILKVEISASKIYLDEVRGEKDGV